VSYLLLVLMLLFFAIGVPVAVAMGGASLAFILLSERIPIVTVAQRMFNGVDSFPLLAIPFFMLSGELMNRGGVTQRLIALAEAIVGHIRGGLAHANIVSSMIMAGMSGSAVADTSATSSVLIPAMRKAGYPTSFSAAVTAASATIGPVIPPSIPFVLYASIAEVSVGRMFLGGVIPGAGMGLFLMGAAYVISSRRGYGSAAPLSLGRLWQGIRNAFLPMMTPAIILGGILTGFFTPTEAAVVASIYSLILGFYYGQLRWRDLPEIMSRVMIGTAVVMLIVAASSLMAWLVAIVRLPQGMLAFFSALTDNPLLILLILNFVLLLLGMLMDSPPIIIMLVPMLLPLLKHFQIDPIHFGVVMVVNLMIGLITPPVGMVMYVTTKIAGVPIPEFLREAWPFMLALLVLLLLITYVPATVTWLPGLLFGR
jgi:tripartite ATP-independent transporter DctM subunit